MEDTELKKTLDELTASLIALKKSDEETEKLNKMDPGEQPAGDEVPDGSATEEVAEEKESEPESHSEPDGDEGVDPAMETGVSVEALQAEYAKLSPEEMKMHMEALQNALMAAEPMAEAAPDMAAPMDDMAMAMGKSQKKFEIELQEVASLKKSIQELGSQLSEEKEKLSKKAKDLDLKEVELRKTVQQVQQAVELLSVPMRKSIANVNVIEKSVASASEELPKEKVQEILRKKMKSNIGQEDRHLINAYSMGEADYSQIEHLLK